MSFSPAPENTNAGHNSSQSDFAATRWTLILSAARGTQTPIAATALAELCRIYWYPLYAFLRHRGHESHEAEDLTQEFFARLLAKDFLKGVEPQKGKFRSFLLASLKHFLSDQRDRARARKRGGGRKVVPLDGLDAESRYRLEPAHDLTPEKMFEKQWALALLDRVLSRLEAEQTADRKAEQFKTLKIFLSGGRSETYAAVAERLGTTEGAVKTAVHRLRRRYRELLREEIAHTVASPEEIDEEIRSLLNCL
ncbi:MAG: sigma-70 family RNA polymerase sigma factor [Pirellulales bacterium]|nr:sigma-70 family RNA polymerase sigma factor [Pirellulales bacterium]